VASTSSQSHVMLVIVVVVMVAMWPTTIKGQACTAGTTCDTNSFLTVSISGNNRVFFSGGCPGYVSTATTPGTDKYQCVTESVALTPTILQSGIGVGLGSCVLGTIGRAINGVALFGPCDANENDAYINEGSTFDPCGGHWEPNHGEYHYHVAPLQNGICIPGFTNTSGKSHSPIFAFMIDGIPLYGPYGDNGVLPTDLDSCGGHTDKTYPYYHYHSPATQTTYPYLVGCLKGCVLSSISSQISKACSSLSATQYDYSSLANFGISNSSASSNAAASASNTRERSPSNTPPLNSSPAGQSIPAKSTSVNQVSCREQCQQDLLECKRNQSTSRICRQNKKTCLHKCN